MCCACAVTSDKNFEIADNLYALHWSINVLRKDHGIDLEVNQNCTWGDNINQRNTGPVSLT